MLMCEQTHIINHMYIKSKSSSDPIDLYFMNTAKCLNNDVIVVLLILFMKRFVLKALIHMVL